MNYYKLLLAGLILGTMCVACSAGPAKSPEVSDRVRKDLDQAKFGDVSVSQDRDKGVVTLSGHVASDTEKAQAESIAKADAAGQVVANEIAVVPPVGDNRTGTVNSDLDKAIEKNLDAALIQNKLDKSVRYDVKNGVVTLKGEVNSEAKRSRVESITSGVPNVQQVVNELDVKSQKATSSK
jgi:hyperosmotically inducible periplasmic protein